MTSSVPAVVDPLKPLSPPPSPNTTAEQTRMVCVPAFASTGQAALLDLETLECTPLRFSSALGDVGGDAQTNAAAAEKNDPPSGMDVEAAAAD